MKLDEIIKLLEKHGAGTKQIVLNRLKEANVDELLELRQSINEKIVSIRSDESESRY